MNYKLAYLARTNPSIQEVDWWARGTALVTYLGFWTRSEDGVEPRWDCGPSEHKVIIEADPPTECTLMSPAGSEGERAYPGPPGRAMARVNVIPDDCEAALNVLADGVGVAPRRGRFGAAGAEV